MLKSMKKSILFLMLIAAISAGAQTNVPDSIFNYTQSGFTDFIVQQTPGKSSADLYKRTLDWAQFYFKSQPKVVKAKIENEYIRIEAYQMGLISFNILMKSPCDTYYQIEIWFKEGRYKMDITELKYYIPATQTMPERWDTFPAQNNGDVVYKKDGTLKAYYKYIPESLTSYFNQLNKDLLHFIKDSNQSNQGAW